MDRRRQAERDVAASPQPLLPSHSHFFRDISNLKTPRPFPMHANPNTPNATSPSPHFFTASKKTPYTSYSTPTSSKSHSTFRYRASSFAAPASRSKTERRLKALELEQSRSARKAQVRREKTLGCLARSLASWLNFLLQNPKACGCKVGSRASDGQALGSFSKGKGKRENFDGGVIEIGRSLKSPKRQRVLSDSSADINISLDKPAVHLLKKSLCKVCSLEDMWERMTTQMSSKSCNEVLLTMTQVCKNIDEGRLKLKPHCPLVTDVAVREKAIKVLMCYNPFWLLIGLHILFGGNSLLLNHGDNDEQFIKEFIEKCFLTHVGIAKTHALNKLVGGLYMHGYYEALGSVILKRFLLLAIALDKAKCESSLPIKHGIDSIDGGSLPLFNCHSHIKSSRQLINEFLSDSMHGEGDLIAHLVIMGCKINYQQFPLCAYDFKVKNIFGDLQDGILLCRAIQLLQCNETLLSKIICPSDTSKKNMQNCSTALKHLQDSGTQISDSDGVMINAADIANGDKELTCSILWNMFVHLQVPLLINRTSLIREIASIKGCDEDILRYNALNEMDLLLQWIQAVCATQNMRVDNYSSLVDGRALTFLIKFYFGDDVILESFFEKENGYEYNDDRVRFFDGLSPTLPNLAHAQKITALLGSCPEVLHPYDLFDVDACIGEKSTAILLVFLASRLLSMDIWNVRNSFRSSQGFQSHVPSFSYVSRLLYSENNEKEPLCSHEDGLGAYATEERSARVIQAHFRRFIVRSYFLKMRISAVLLQSAIRAWLAAIFGTNLLYGTLTCSTLHSTNGIYDRYLAFFIERRRFHRIRNATIFIQHFVRAWLRRKQNKEQSAKCEFNKARDRSVSARKIQQAWKDFLCNKHSKRHYSAIKIQSQWSCLLTRKDYLCQVKAIRIIQSAVRSLKVHNTFQNKLIAAIEIQRFIRGHLARTMLLGASNSQSCIVQRRTFGAIDYCVINNFELRIVISSIIRLQRWWKRLLIHRSRMHAAIEIQTFVRSWIAQRAAAKRKQNISKIQKWWRNILFLKKRKVSVLIIQAHVRGWIARQKAAQSISNIFKIQSCWKGYLVRKHSRPQLLNLRHRMKLSAANVNDEMRLINKLLVALSELLGYRSISNIRHTCATLDMATELSQKCCEAFVDGGAVNILLKQIQLLNRGVPDQEVLKHVLSTLRNIVRYNHLSRVLINTYGSLEIIFQELLRNKNEGFLISCHLLRRVCSVQEGLQAVGKLQKHVKRLSNSINELERKAMFLERNVNLNNQRDLTVRRLKEATSLMSLITSGHI